MPGEQPDSRDEGVLSPSDLDITNSEYAAEIEEGRYVVSTDASPPEAQSHRSTETDSDPPLDPTAASYGIDIEARIEGHVSNYRIQSNDVVTVFSDLLRWYATRVDDDLDSDQVLQILVAESDLAIGPRPIVDTALDRYDLSPTDSIADLIDSLDSPRQ